jgi:hypothetical protein
LESTRLVEIAEPVVLDEGCVKLLFGAVIRRFDAHLGATLRENLDDPKLFADVWWPWPFQLLVAPPFHELDGSRAAATEEFPRLAKECHWPSLVVVEGPRVVVKEEFPRLPNECHWPSLVVVEGPRVVVKEGFPRPPNECHWPLPLAEPKLPKALDEGGPAG